MPYEIHALRRPRPKRRPIVWEPSTSRAAARRDHEVAQLLREVRHTGLILSAKAALDALRLTALNGRPEAPATVTPTELDRARVQAALRDMDAAKEGS